MTSNTWPARSRTDKPRSALLVTLAVFAAACGMENTEGDFKASRAGDLSNPLSVRQDPLSNVAAACALEAPFTADRSNGLVRRPYLQQVTESAAELFWTTTEGAQPASLTVTRPDGSAVLEVTPEIDAEARPPGAVQWRAPIVGLEADTTYCYALSIGDSVRRAGFRTAPRPGGAQVRFVALGDSGGGGADQLAVLAQMKTVPFDFFVHVGDIAYDSGTRGALESRFFRVYEDLLDNMPVFPITGNHDYDADAAAPFFEAFSLPRNGSAELPERWYSYDWGDVHFVMLDTERTGAAQAQWLEADLAATTRPWKIVVLHKPPYSSGEHGSDGAVRRHFVPLFERHGVQLVLTGHDHDYERSRPQNGVTYIVTGGGGIGTRPVGRSTFTAFSESVLHFVYVTVASDSLTVHAIDATGAVFDSLALRR